MNHPGNRRAPARIDVGRRARDCARRGQPAKERRGKVRGALRDQLRAGAMRTPDHPVGDDRGQQRFYPGEQRNREGGG